MRSGRTLVSLAHELQRQLDTKKDLVVPSPLVHHSTSEGGGTTLVVEETSGPAAYGVTPLARRLKREEAKGGPRTVRVFLPRQAGSDWADVWRQRQEAVLLRAA